jgi:hypothetical protein
MIKSRFAPPGRVKFIDRGIVSAARMRQPDGGGFKDLDRAAGVITQTASATNESPLESSSLRNGVFTFYMPLHPDHQVVPSSDLFIFSLISCTLPP